MRDLLRICTAGSVDDGKSTLIGRLLYDARGVYEDQVRAVERVSSHRGAGPIDFSLFTDGLRAEREQGITIDVAYRYFATARRKFILADTPGHEQYTRNMATGASTADVAILLVDARHGVRPQSERHARIARLLGINDFILAINKMDLVAFDRGVFEAIVGAFAPHLAGARTHAVPVSALLGDNVTARSSRTAWYDGPGLLPYLETVEPRRTENADFRFPVQLVIRPGDGFRGYAGRVLSGSVRVGELVTVWPSGVASRVSRIITRDGELDVAPANRSLVITLEDDIDVSRGDVLAIGTPAVASSFMANLVWMDERPLDPSRVYRLKHTTRTVGATIDRALALNEIGAVAVSASRPLVFDAYTDSRATGSFVLIDADSNFTAAAGMIMHAATGASTAARFEDTAQRLAALARRAATEADATVAIRRALEELLV